MQEALFGGTDATTIDQNPKTTAQKMAAAVAGASPAAAGAVRTRPVDRSQVGMHYCSIDELITADHQVRVIWEAVCQMDLSGFEEPIKAREGGVGRSANDVRVMVGLWLWAAINNVSRGRRLAVLCENDLTFRWMCGGLSMNYHTLNNFRTGHQKALDELFTATLGRLMHAKLVTVERISQDGLRTRASAGTSSFKRRETLEGCLVEAEAHLAELRKQQDAPEESDKNSDDPDGQAGHRTQKEAIAQDRVDRVRQALSEMTKVEAAKAKQSNKHKREKQPRVSTTDPEARTMKMPNGGFNPAYNVQFATDPISRAIVGLEVSNCGGDAPLSEPMRKQVEQRTGQKVSEQLIDGGYVNTDVRTYRGLSPLSVRGIAKATCVVLWSALAYNLMHFASALT